MLPVISRFKAPVFTIQEIEQASWFEILLFKSRLRFRNPQRNLEDSVNLFGDKGYDKRPFVNTLSRSHYLCEEEAGLCFETLYTTGWKFYPEGWFKPAFASLRLTLTVHGVLSTERDHFPDLLKPEHAQAWIVLKYQQRYQLYNEMTLQKSGDDFELKFHDPEWASRQAQQKDYLIESMNINGIPVFKARPEPNIVEFFVPFSSEDILKFSFRLQALNNKSIENKMDFVQKASAWVESIMQTLQLDIESTRLSREN
jgi:hypothetical protein